MVSGASAFRLERAFCYFILALENALHDIAVELTDRCAFQCPCDGNALHDANQITA